MVLKLTNKKNNNKSGFAILETLFYIAIFAIFSVLVINAMVVMIKSFKETRIQSQLVQGSQVLEKISREIRQAKSINTLGIGDLKLNTSDSAGVDKTVRFVMSGTDVQFYENDVLIGKINSNNLQINSLTFNQISTVKGSAVKAVLNVEVKDDVQNRTKDFYNTVVLRGDY